MCEHKEKRLYIVSIVLLMIFPCSFLLMPISNYVQIEYSRLVSILIGAVFWITGIGGYVALVIVYSMKKTKGQRKGQIFIFTNTITAIADVAFVLGLAVLAVLIMKKLTAFYVTYVDIFFIVAAWNMHWLFSRDFQKKIL